MQEVKKWVNLNSQKIILAITRVRSIKFTPGVRRGVWNATWRTRTELKGQPALPARLSLCELLPWSSAHAENLGGKEKKKTLESYGKKVMTGTNRGTRQKSQVSACERDKLFYIDEPPDHRCQEQKQEMGPKAED